MAKKVLIGGVKKMLSYSVHFEWVVYLQSKNGKGSKDNFILKKTICAAFIPISHGVIWRRMKGLMESKRDSYRLITIVCLSQKKQFILARYTFMGVQLFYPAS